MSTPSKNSFPVYVLAIFGALLIVAALAGLMIQYTAPEPANQGRATERLKNLTEQRALDAKLSQQLVWVDQSKGLVGLDIQRAKEITLKEWQNPAAARSNLIQRVEKATAPAPKAPEKPNPFE